MLEVEFSRLLLEYNASKHAPLAGYLKSRLNSFVVDYYRKASAKKRSLESDGERFKIKSVDAERMPGIKLIHDTSPRSDKRLIQQETTFLSQKIYEKLESDLSPKTKEFIKIWLKNPDAKEGELAKLAGISNAMIKKHKSYIRQKAIKYEKDLFSL